MTKQYYNLVRVLALLGILDQHGFRQAQLAYPVEAAAGEAHYVSYTPFSMDPRVTFEQLMDPDWRGPFTP